VKCLAVNTANTLLTLALVVDGQVVHAYETTETRDQGNLLLQHAQKALDQASLTYQQLDGHVNIVCVESWREELYFQANDAGGNIIIPPVNLSPEDFVLKLAAVKGPYVLSGDAAEKLQPLLAGCVMHDAKITAADAARIAIAKFKKTGQGEHPVPFYLREADVTVAKS